jgi:hypothetical protein
MICVLVARVIYPVPTVFYNYGFRCVLFKNDSAYEL